MSDDINELFDETETEVKRAYKVLQGFLGITHRPDNNPTKQQLEAEAALIYLYQQAQKGLQPRRDASLRTPPGTKRIVSRDRVAEAAAIVLRRGVDEGRYSYSAGSLPDVEQRGFKARVHEELQKGKGVKPSKQVVSDIFKEEKFAFFIAMKYEGR